MGNRDKDKNIDTSVGLQETNARRLNELVHLVKRHTRTERHLEQHSDIARLEKIKETLEVQKEREQHIEHLKNLIVNGKGNDDAFKNLQRNYKYTNNYLQHHAGRLDSFTLEKTREKQQHREDQMKFLH